MKSKDIRGFTADCASPSLSTIPSMVIIKAFIWRHELSVTSLTDKSAELPNIAFKRFFNSDTEI